MSASTLPELPAGLLDQHDLNDLDRVIPRLARDAARMDRIEAHVSRLPSQHRLVCADARRFDAIDDDSVHLVVTSPPYWTLKRYNDVPGQLGHLDDFDAFLDALDEVWRRCFRVLVPGGRLVCVVGDVCLSRRRNSGRHTVVPLHAAIQERCRRIGFDNLAPVIWYKIANARYEVENGGGGFLGKPYEPNAVIKNDVEFILMQRKPGGYRRPTPRQRILSVIRVDDHRRWFRQVWTDVAGASTRKHPAPFPLELAERLVRMFSFVGDTVFDPFMGTGTTNLAAARWGRNSVGVEVDPQYFQQAQKRLERHRRQLYVACDVEVHASDGTPK